MIFVAAKSLLPGKGHYYHTPRFSYNLRFSTSFATACFFTYLTYWERKCKNISKSPFKSFWKDFSRCFYIFVPSDLDLWPLDRKFAPIVTIVQCYVSTKFPTVLLLRENRRRGTDGQTDVQCLTRPHRQSRIIKSNNNKLGLLITLHPHLS